ncbi:hypothetical protein NCS57_00939200 [Fusarium keratoplasticum]|uniref:Uncharacterized protein n=1 Tax=Fusarium keratoplasticum TaxID=1328300 RepID=A0ACC0QRS9_9HYPO|nr:hypothetical protein NCS57_00939200 [Fusarium keratoplasticum]KAI8663384.1 hypothetical protein NCS57_00939200 [Fusarium keratoplasticum]KAI8664072.1 hypothetical protein NCS55_00914200 [Fusarium keratoplasticum]
MTGTEPATSILEFLTHPNPIVSHRPPKRKTNSRNQKWHAPKQIKKWDEFHDFNVFKESFGGRLLEEARREGRDLPAYPDIDDETDCVERNEDDTRELYAVWTKRIVTAALRPIRQEFHSAVWSKGDAPQDDEPSEPPPRPEKQRQLPRRECSVEARTPRMQSLKGLRPDSGTTLRNTSPRTGDPDPDTHRPERFPKEYKPAEKWKSKWMAEVPLINESGEWERGRSGHDLAWPIKQAYTYCIQNMCRYGCILTCHEAFIFRVRPRSIKSADGSQDTKVLQRQLIRDGLMEYISIPWANHRQGDLESHETWTINLALWFMHILVGNKYEVCWRYDRLQDETLAALRLPQDEPLTHEDQDEDEDESSDSDTSDRTVPFDESIFTPLRKRKRDAEAEEGFNLSFSKRQFLQT